MSGSPVALQQVHKTYPNGCAALGGVDLEVAAGEWLVLVGPSGCGKTTTLRVIAGLEHPERGTIRIAGQAMDDVPPWRRGVAMVFQRPALLPTFSVRENLAESAPAAAAADIDAVADVLGLRGELNRLPHQLSGGQQQRVALARAMVRKAPLCLLDEPLGQLDAPLRDDLRRHLKQWHQSQPATVISVTHDPREAWAMADRVAVMQQGRIVQIGSPREVDRQPYNRFVAAFFAQEPFNFFEVQLRKQADSIQWNAAGWPDAISWHGPAEVAEAMLGLRASDVQVGAGHGGPMTVSLVEPMRGGAWVTGEVHGRQLTGWTEQPPDVGTKVGITMKWTNAYVFDRVTGKTLHAPMG